MLGGRNAWSGRDPSGKRQIFPSSLKEWSAPVAPLESQAPRASDRTTTPVPRPVGEVGVEGAQVLPEVVHPVGIAAGAVAELAHPDRGGGGLAGLGEVAPLLAAGRGQLGGGHGVVGGAAQTGDGGRAGAEE